MLLIIIIIVIIIVILIHLEHGRYLAVRFKDIHVIVRYEDRIARITECLEDPVKLVLFGHVIDPGISCSVLDFIECFELCNISRYEIA